MAFPPCDPLEGHTKRLNFISERFGQSDDAITLTKVLRNSVKLTRSREQCSFLMTCRRLGLVPFFILNCVKLPAINNQCNSSINHVLRFQKAMLNDAISNLHGRIAFLTREARRSPEHLRSVPGHHHSWFLKMCTDICRKEAKESNNRLDRKLKNLVAKQDKPDAPSSRQCTNADQQCIIANFL